MAHAPLATPKKPGGFSIEDVSASAGTKACLSWRGLAGVRYL